MGREGEDVASTSAAGGLSLRMPSRLHPASVKGAAWQVRGDWGAQVSHSAIYIPADQSPTRLASSVLCRQHLTRPGPPFRPWLHSFWPHTSGLPYDCA